MNQRLWTVINRLQHRMSQVDLLEFLTSDVVSILREHLQTVRRYPADCFPGHPCQASQAAELHYLRRASEAMIHLLLPERDCRSELTRSALRELLATQLFRYTVEQVCDPHYVNQLIVGHVTSAAESLQKSEEAKKAYAYAKTYSAFCKMINESSDPEVLADIRYHVIVEIMQANQVQELKDLVKRGDVESSTARAVMEDRGKAALLKSRNLGRYINQCRYALNLCEKRMEVLGGADPRSKLYSAKRSSSHMQNQGAIPLAAVLQDPQSYQYLMQYLVGCHGTKNFVFWMACQALRTDNDVFGSVPVARLADVYEVLQSSLQAPTNLKLSRELSTTVRHMAQRLQLSGGGPDADQMASAEDVTVMMQAQDESLLFIEKVYNGFVLSEHYRRWVHQPSAAPAVDCLIPSVFLASPDRPRRRSPHALVLVASRPCRCSASVGRYIRSSSSRAPSAEASRSGSPTLGPAASASTSALPPLLEQLSSPCASGTATPSSSPRHRSPVPLRRAASEADVATGGSPARSPLSMRRPGPSRQLPFGARPAVVLKGAHADGGEPWERQPPGGSEPQLGTDTGEPLAAVDTEGPQRLSSDPADRANPSEAPSLPLAAPPREDTPADGDKQAEDTAAVESPAEETVEEEGGDVDGWERLSQTDDDVNLLNDYSVRIAAKVAEVEEAKEAGQAYRELEAEVQQLTYSRRRLERYLEVADQWWDNMGSWSVKVEAAGSGGETDAELQTTFMIIVQQASTPTSSPVGESAGREVTGASCIPDNNTPSPAPESDTAQASGWIIIRDLREFRRLHVLVRQLDSALPKEIRPPDAAKKQPFWKRRRNPCVVLCCGTAFSPSFAFGSCQRDAIVWSGALLCLCAHLQPRPKQSCP